MEWMISLHLTLTSPDPPLVLAAPSLLQVMQYMMSKGADIDAIETAGRSVVLIATRSRKPEPVRLLIQAGCKLNAQSFTGHTAFHGVTEVGACILYPPSLRPQSSP